MKTESTRTDSLPTRPSLLGRLINLTDDQSWREFYLTYEVHVRKIARRHGLSEEDAQEVAQDVLRHIAQTITTYQRSPHRGAFRSWLFQLTHWRAADRLRRRRPDDAAALPQLPPRTDAAGGGKGVEDLPATSDLDHKFERDAQRYLLGMLLQRLGQSVSSKHVQMFEMLMLDEVPVAKVAELFQVRPAAVYVIKHRLMEKLRQTVAEMKPFAE